MNYLSTNSPSVQRRGFTIIEMLVTIGILVVVAAGVATIFSSVGETVAKGRKLSELNQFAARIERVMREDFENMTRDGFMVIVNKNANFGEDVRLYRGDQSDFDADGELGRSRRSDEIMFFARGDFESARRAITPGMIPTSTEAAIYYGHGQKRRPDLLTNVDSPQNYFFNPQPWDNNFDDVLDTRLGVETPGQVNPNEFARDWALLRQMTLLVNPEGPGQPVPAELFDIQADNPASRAFLQDSPRQVALQPAARSIFTALSGSDGMENHRWLYDLSNVGPSPINPPPHYRVSGLVDVVTEDLSTIRNKIQALAGASTPFRPRDYFGYAPAPPRPNSPPILVSKDAFDEEYFGDPMTSPRPADALSISLGWQTNAGSWNTVNQTQANAMRQWMIDALPSRWDLSTDSPSFVSGVRYEDIPTRLLFNEDDFDDTPSGRIARAYAEANQEMLGASVFVPRCTEFIVEWSYGFVDHSITDPNNPRFKEIQWYGHDRYVDSNNDGVLDENDRRVTTPYTPRRDVAAGDDPQTNQARPQGPAPELVVGESRPAVFGGGAPTLAPGQVEIATFGFATEPDQAGAVWPWPKLIRITMSLGDPNDRDIEETYQVVFEVPSPE